MIISARRLIKYSPVVVLVGLALAPSAFAQASRTWVSGTGDDANPCSRTAPCKTFAGTIMKTAAGGEISVIDPGGFGGVTITKAITIDGSGNYASTLVSGSNSINVVAGTGDKVILRNLSINGIGTGLDGVNIVSAKSVSIEHSKIFGFTRDGVDIAPTTGSVRVNIGDSQIENNGGGGVFASPNGGTGIAILHADQVDNNGCGAVAGSYGYDTSFNFTVNCGTNPSTASPTGRGNITAFNSSFNNNTASGVYSNGPRAFNQISGDDVVANITGLLAVNGGSILSWSNNFVYANGTNGAPTGTLTPMIRRSKRP